MKLRKTGITFLLGAAITSATPAPVLAQSCAEVVANLQVKTAALNNEARLNSADFLRDELVGPALDTAKRTLAGSGDPTVAAYNQVQDAREKAQAWIDRLNSYDGFVTRLQECHATSCNMLDFVNRENVLSRLAGAAQDKLNEWVQSLADSGITAAAERVNKVSSIVKNTLSGAQGIAEGGVTGAVNCMNQYVQNAAIARADAVDTGSSTPGVTAPPRSGSGVGKIIGMTALLGGAAVAGVLVASAASDLEDFSSIGTPVGTPVGSPPTSTTPPSSTANFRYGNWNCGASTQCAANFGSATGSIGPMCTQALCDDFVRGNPSSNGTTCTVQPIHTPVRNGPAPGRACIDQR
jgi:hypothetical protein